MFRLVIALGIFSACAAQLLPIPLPEKTLRPPTTTTAAPSKPATYWITYSRKVRPGHPMSFQVRIFKGTNPVDISVVLRNKAGEAVLTAQPVSVTPGATKTIEVMIPLDIPLPGDRWDRTYNLEVFGRGLDVNFKQKGYVSLQDKSFSIFVQTDKAMYRPSDTVKFRTLAMTPDMKVMRDVKQEILVMDPQNNRIVQFLDVAAPLNMGVVQKEFPLAGSVPTGKWQIKVKIEDTEVVKEFEVDDYVLPRFEVEIDGLPYSVSSNHVYTFTVKSKYTFGKPVTDGTVVVDISRNNNYYWGRIPPKHGLLKRGKLNKDGEATFQVTVKELLEYMSRSSSYTVRNINGYMFNIQANVTEARTGKTQSSDHVVQYYDSIIALKFVGITPNSFQTGLDFTAYIEVTKQDGALFTAEESKNIKVNINVTYDVPAPPPSTVAPEPTTSSPSKPGETTVGLLFPDEPSIALPRREHDYYYPRTVSKELTLDRNVYGLPPSGWVVVTFRVPDEATSINIQAETDSILGTVTRHHYASPRRSPSDNFLQLGVTNKKPKVGDIVTVQAKATETMKSLEFQVFSKGLLLLSKEVTNPGSAASFQFKATASMSPSMSIVAFYVRENGEFVNDALSLSVDGLFGNAVSIEFDKKKVQPGEKVNAIVKGEKDSLVFLLAVDKSVKLLKSGNDITQDMVREELASYDFGNYGHWRYMFICGWPSYFGGSDAASIFQNAGVAVMTDGLVYSRYNDDFLVDDGLGRIPEPAATAMPLPEAGNDSGGTTVSKGTAKPATRKFFPENWLWKMAAIPSDSQGTVTVSLTAPDTITSWVLSVFSAHQQSGLSVAEEPAEVITFRNMFVSLDLPSSIIRNEDFCFTASVFNYYPGRIPVVLTLDQSPDFNNIWAKLENDKIVLQSETLSVSHFMGFMEENEIKSVMFCFTPTTLGSIPVRVSALTNVAGLSDSVERKLRVKPEGFPRSTTYPYLVEPVNGVWDETVQTALPSQTVQGSERITVNIAGNLLGTVFDNIEDLVRKPYGCGEQNMINFAPLMSLLDFFFTTNTITDEIREKAVKYILIGYQKEILYEHSETGGYSTFGNTENTKEKPSMWLTAFVTKCFAQAKLLDLKYKEILAMDNSRLLRSARWMYRQQARNGSFVEHGRVFNKRLQGGSGKGVALTAYSVISLHHTLQILRTSGLADKSTENALARAVAYLESQINQLGDPYEACIAAYALNLVDSRLADASFDKMDLMSQKTSGMVFWKRQTVEEKNTYYWSRNSEAINIEMTSYALLTYSLRGIGTSKGLPIVRWLSKQKGENGGFISTQDTVIGIEALTSVAKELYGAEFVPMTVQVTTEAADGTAETIDFKVTKANEMILQRKDIPYKAGGGIKLHAFTDNPTANTDKSTVLVDVVFHYNIDVETTPVVYDMDHEITFHNDGYDMVLKVWTIDGTVAGMSMLEVEIPAGYTPDIADIKETNSRISDVEVKEDNLNIYIDTDVIDGRGIKLKLRMENAGGKLTKSKGKSYKVYNYYEPELELTKYYFLNEVGDFCDKVPSVGMCPFVKEKTPLSVVR